MSPIQNCPAFFAGSEFSGGVCGVLVALRQEQTVWQFGTWSVERGVLLDTKRPDVLPTRPRDWEDEPVKIW